MSAIEMASERAGVDADTLMENAGLAVAAAVRDEIGGYVAGQRILVLVGPGNNGADGLVAARHLRRWGGEVTCCLLTRRPDGDPKLALAEAYGVECLSAPDLGELRQIGMRSTVVIDALLGTGRSRPLSGPLGAVMLLLGEMPRDTRSPKLVALDLPTGLNADTGEVDPACPHFDVTLALGYVKAGLLRFPGAGNAGRVEVLDIGVPPDLREERSVEVEMLTSGWISSLLPPRRPDSHKGTHGHNLVVAGSRHYVGAAWLASQASVRAGAGLTTLASPRGVYPLVAAMSAEAIHLPLPDDDGRIAVSAAEVIRSSARGYSAMLVGCGLGWSEGTGEFVRLFLSDRADAAIPLLIDADGLNNLSAIDDWRARILGPVVLTPHPGEMATLTGMSVAHIQAARESVAREWAERWNSTVVLKGAFTVVASPGEPVRIAPFANPALATGGTGDVLSGIISSLLAQGMRPADAAVAGVWIHAAAAEQLASRIGWAGLAASDLLPALPPAMAALRRDTLE